MFFADFLFALCIALLLSAIFTLVFGRRGPWESVLVFFLLVFLASWAGGVWLSPFGPVLWGSYWFPFLVAGFVIALVLASMPPGRSESTVDLVEQAEEEREAKALLSALGIFFWILILALLAAIIFGYLKG